MNISKKEAWIEFELRWYGRASSGAPLAEIMNRLKSAHQEKKIGLICVGMGLRLLCCPHWEWREQSTRDGRSGMGGRT